MYDYLRKLPSVNEILEKDYLKEYLKRYKQDYVKNIISEEINEIREYILKTNNVNTEIINNLDKKIILRLSSSTDSLKTVVNGTGVIIHTNLGRSPISKEIMGKIIDIGSSYSNLEYNLENGTRGQRDNHLSSLINSLTGAEDSIIVNNNAAAVLLSLSTFSKNKDIIISRGELVEIGGSFRIPDICEASGAKLKEIGTTNRTHLYDYENSINDNTGLIMKVHTSNYIIKGFTKEVEVKELVDISIKSKIPFLYDIGSGLIENKGILINEPNIQDLIKCGVDIITFSGDKLIGGPQLGIIAGKKRYIDKLKKNPIYRAVRVDKLNIKLMEETLKVYLKNKNIQDDILIYKMINKTYDETYRDCTYILNKLKTTNLLNVNIIDGESVIGGGALPEKSIKTACLNISSSFINLNKLNNDLKKLEKPLILTIKNDSLLINTRTLLNDDLDYIIDVFNKIIEEFDKNE